MQSISADVGFVVMGVEVMALVLRDSKGTCKELTVTR